MTSPNWRWRLFLIAFFGFLSFSIMTPIGSNDVRNANRDYNNHLAAILQGKMALEEGQYFLRVAPFEHKKMGYALFQFSSPTTYTLAAYLTEWITPNPLITYKILIWLSSVIGGVFAYRFLYLFFQTKYPALLGATCYVLNPLHIILIGRMGALNEFIASNLIAVLLFYAFLYYKTEKKIFFMPMALLWYLLITIHLVTFFYFSFVFFIFITLLARTENRLSLVLNQIFIFFFALLLSAWHLLPVFLLSAFFRIQNTFSGMGDFSFYTPLSGLFAIGGSSPWPILVSPNKPIILPLHPAIGWPMLLGIGTAIYAMFHKKGAYKNIPPFVIASLLLYVVIFVLVWTPFDFWQFIPEYFKVGQYPWRLMTQMLWLGIIPFTWSLSYLFKNHFDVRHFIVGTLLVGASISSWLPTALGYTESLNALIKNPQIGFSREDYLLDLNRYPALAQLLESFGLKIEAINKNGISFTEVSIPEPLIIYSKQPKIKISGEIVERPEGGRAMELIVLHDKQIIGRYPLKTAGKFTWILPLDRNTLLKVRQPNHTLELKISPDASTSNKLVAIKEAMLNGYLHAPETLLVQESLKYCNRRNGVLTCDIPSFKQVQRINLPFIFYPSLLSVKNNGHAVPYQGALYDGVPVVSLIPESKHNHIEIRFTGLQAANILSAIAFIIGLVIFLLEYFRPNLKKPPHASSTHPS